MSGQRLPGLSMYSWTWLLFLRGRTHDAREIDTESGANPSDHPEGLGAGFKSAQLFAHYGQTGDWGIHTYKFTPWLSVATLFFLIPRRLPNF